MLHNTEMSENNNVSRSNLSEGQIKNQKVGSSGMNPKDEVNGSVWSLRCYQSPFKSMLKNYNEQFSPNAPSGTRKQNSITQSLSYQSVQADNNQNNMFYMKIQIKT